MKELIEQKITEIANVLLAVNLKKEFSIDLSLLSGELGALIFLKYYSIIYDQVNIIKTLEKRFDIYFDNLVSHVLQISYCNGISGILYGLNLLDKSMSLNIDYNDVEKHYKKYLFRMMKWGFNNCNYDYFHGSLGILLGQMDDVKFVKAAIRSLEQAAVIDGEKIKWYSFIDFKEKRGINISLSHGMSSLVIILCRIYEKNIESKSVQTLITGAVNYILSQRIDYNIYGCFFPIQSLESDTFLQKSRLAWCYGDLGIALALWEAGKVLQNSFWKSVSLNIMLESCTRRSIDDTLIKDAGICHGSSGLAMIFYYMYNETRNFIFMETCNYWISVTLKMASFKDGLAGYKTWNGNYKNDCSLLTGISGIGLMLLTVVSNNPICFEWNHFFLLLNKH